MSFLKTLFHFQAYLIYCLNVRALEAQSFSNSRLQFENNKFADNTQYENARRDSPLVFTRDNTHVSKHIKDQCTTNENEPLDLSFSKEKLYKNDSGLFNPVSLTCLESVPIDKNLQCGKKAFRCKAPECSYSGSFTRHSAVVQSHVDSDLHKAQHCEKRQSSGATQYRTSPKNNYNIPNIMECYNNIINQPNRTVCRKRGPSHLDIRGGLSKKQKTENIVDTNISSTSKNICSDNKYVNTENTTLNIEKSMDETKLNVRTAFEKNEPGSVLSIDLYQNKHNKQCVSTNLPVDFKLLSCSTEECSGKKNIEKTRHIFDPSTIYSKLNSSEKNFHVRKTEVFTPLKMKETETDTGKINGKIFKVQYGLRSESLEDLTVKTIKINDGRIYSFFLLVESVTQLQSGHTRVVLVIKNIPMFWVLYGAGVSKVALILDKKTKLVSFYKDVKIQVDFTNRECINYFETLPIFALTNEKDFFAVKYVKRITDWKCSNEQTADQKFNETTKVENTQQFENKNFETEKKNIGSKYQRTIQSILGKLNENKKIIMFSTSRNKENMIKLVEKLDKLKSHLTEMKQFKLPLNDLNKGVQKIYNFLKEFNNGGEHFLNLLGINYLEKRLIRSYDRVYTNFKQLLSSIVHSYNMFLREESDELLI
ncbi:hypothetical protein CDIK_3518 [Cucumispora dikerogammari]|nr:hypothetical protein CDIK_3518 [Cucumispora dikerogammari]